MELLLLVPLVRFLIIGSPWAPMILAAIVTSDLLDGPIARRLGTAGSRGALIDASCDVLVVMSAAMAEAILADKAVDKKISSTNMQERLHREIRRRSRVGGIFPQIKRRAVKGTARYS